ncbi:MAG: hypothetical protein ACP5UN_01975 [Candidatus Micrarchaeia archaeon]
MVRLFKDNPNVSKVPEKTNLNIFGGFSSIGLNNLISAYEEKIKKLEYDNFGKCEIEQAKNYLNKVKIAINKMQIILPDKKEDSIENKIDEINKEFLSSKFLFESYMDALEFSIYLYENEKRKPIKKLNENIKDINKLQELFSLKLLRNEQHISNPSYLFSLFIKRNLVAKNIVDNYINNKDYKNNVWYKFIRDSFNTLLIKFIELGYTNIDLEVHGIKDKNLKTAAFSDFEINKILNKILTEHSEIVNKELLDPKDIHKTINNVYSRFIKNFNKESIKNGSLFEQIFDKNVINIINNRYQGKNLEEKDSKVPYYSKIIIGTFIFSEVTEQMNNDDTQILSILHNIFAMDLLKLISVVEKNIKNNVDETKFNLLLYI